MRLKIRSVLILQQQGTETHQIIHVPVAQWIEQWPPEPCAQVRFLSGAFQILKVNVISSDCKQSGNQKFERMELWLETEKKN